MKTMTLTTPQSVSPGNYYVGFLANGTAMPAIISVFGLAGYGGSVGGVPRVVKDTTHTGLTTSFYSPATLTFNNTLWWAAVS